MIEITITVLEIIGIGFICVCVGGTLCCFCRKNTTIYA